MCHEEYPHCNGGDYRFEDLYYRENIESHRQRVNSES